MSEQNPDEIWQVEVGGQIYEAPFGVLGDWIGEGSLLSQDKVRKGNLRWIEARKVPNLVRFFNAKEKSLPMPVVVKTTDAVYAPLNEPEQPVAAVPPDAVNVGTADIPGCSAQLLPEVTSSAKHTSIDPNFCAKHSGIPSEYVCDGCQNGFCRTCPKSYGGSVKICPFCGAMCRSLAEIKQTRAAAAARTSASEEGFGVGDFFAALAHPFNFKPSLVFGSLIFMFFMLGREASAIGGIFMIAGAIFSAMAANALTFGVLANTVQNFSQGRLEENFMPEFDDFSLWDDVIHPFILGIGAYLVSFGPFFAALIVGFFMIANSVNSQLASYERDLEKLPGTHYYTGRETVKQSQDVRKVIGRLDENNDQRLAMQEQIATGNTNVDVDDDTRQQEELWQEIQDARAAQFESEAGPSPEKQELEKQAAIQAFLDLAPPIVVMGAILFLWGAFFFPAACAIAGYTRSFTATINPMVGLDTIKRLGSAYPKILAMGLVLVIASAIFAGLLSAVLSPFDLGGFGNLPVTAVSALFTFYLCVVFSCVLGYAMFKRADKLGLPR